MKKNIIIYSLTLLMGLSGCSLDAFPGSDIITEEQKDEILSKNPDSFIAEINALSANLIKYNTLESSGIHFDYGYAAVCMIYDTSGMDLVSDNVGYNWYNSTLSFRDRLDTSINTKFIWRVFYNNIKVSNDILVNINGMLETTTDPSQIAALENYKGQALAHRAFGYLNLVQAYQFTYKGHEDAPAVPLKLTLDDERYNATRATVSEVYDVILSDLNESIELLKDKKRASEAKDKVSVQVAYGLRARVNLVMNNWKAAAEDAQKAQEGFTPLSIDAVSKPGFNSAKNDSWMWANLITEENDIVATGIINWPSHLCSFTGNGYTVGTQTYRRINQPLWDEIPENDIRKHWWVDEEKKAPYVDEIKFPTSQGEMPLVDYLGWDSFTNLKFGAYNNEILNPMNASDWVMMRVEEMILIEAEAKAMSGDLEGGKSVLANFLKTYRNPGYVTSKATSAEDFQTEVWKERRVELWGEGFALFDLLRLKKPLERVKVAADGKKLTTYGPTVSFNTDPEAQILLFLIPESEIEANTSLSKADNNPTAEVPKPMELKIKE